MELYVNYTVSYSGGHGFQAGPFSTEQTARENMRDIRSYASITDCYISGERDPARVLITELRIDT